MPLLPTPSWEPADKEASQSCIKTLSRINASLSNLYIKGVAKREFWHPSAVLSGSVLPLLEIYPSLLKCFTTCKLCTSIFPVISNICSCMLHWLYLPRHVAKRIAHHRRWHHRQSSTVRRVGCKNACVSGSNYRTWVVKINLESLPRMSLAVRVFFGTLNTIIWFLRRSFSILFYVGASFLLMKIWLPVKGKKKKHAFGTSGPHLLLTCERSAMD